MTRFCAQSQNLDPAKADDSLREHQFVSVPPTSALLLHYPSGAKFASTIHHDSYPAIAQADQRGRTVLITGASKGIGRATAISFAKAGAANIIIAARSTASTKWKKRSFLKLQLDVSSESSVADAVALVRQTLDHLDILINNAGYLEDWKPVAETDPEEWWKSWEVNIKGVYLMTRAFLPLLLQSSAKTIVNLSSAGAPRVRPGASAYQTTKFALLRFTEFVATEYADQGLVAFAIHPGGVPTELALNMPEQMHQVLVDTPQLAADSVTC
ncbi:hypothetical protein V1509DRAFT_651300 [Lipomyces kononenkoae]